MRPGHGSYWPRRKCFIRCLYGYLLMACYRHVHILGSVQNIKIARDAVVSLILGSPPGTQLCSPDYSCHRLTCSRQGVCALADCGRSDEAAVLGLSGGGWVTDCFACILFRCLLVLHRSLGRGSATQLIASGDPTERPPGLIAGPRPHPHPSHAIGVPRPLPERQLPARSFGA